MNAPAKKTVGSKRQVALLRGINVGRAKRIAMADLRALAEKLGCEDVSTLLNSGNLIYSTAEPCEVMAKNLCEAIATQLLVRCRVQVLELDEVEALLARNPLKKAESDASRFLIAAVATDVDPLRLAELMRMPARENTLACIAPAIYLHCPEGILESPLPDAMHRLLGDGQTTRNWATWQKILQRLRQS